MVEAVLEDVIANRQQRIDYTDIGGVSGGEQQGPGTARERRQGLLQVPVSPGMPADKVRRAGADAPFSHRACKGLGDARIRSETEVVIAAEVEQPAAVDDQLATLRPLHDPAAPIQALVLKRVETRADVLESTQAVPLLTNKRAH